MGMTNYILIVVAVMITVIGALIIYKVSQKLITIFYNWASNQKFTFSCGLDDKLDFLPADELATRIQQQQFQIQFELFVLANNTFIAFLMLRSENIEYQVSAL